MFIRNGALVIISKVKKIKKIGKSIHFQIVCISILIGLVPLMIMKSVLSSSYETEMMKKMEMDLKYAGGILANQLGNNVTVEDGLTEKNIAEIEQIGDLYNGRVIVVNSSFKVVYDTYLIDLNKYSISSQVFSSFQGKKETVIYYDESKHFFELTIPIMNDSEKNSIGVIVMTVPTTSVLELGEGIRERFVILDFVIIIIVATIAYQIGIYFSRPLKKVKKSIDKIKDGNLNAQLEQSSFTELQQITDSFNGVLKQLKLLDQSRQEFVSNVSNELKTPITSIRVLADSLLSQEDVPVEIYREFMTDISEEIDRETTIINDLLSLVKLDKTATEMNVVENSINDLIEMILKRLRPIARERNIEVIFESFRPVIADVDKTKFSLALTNLIENAIKYNKDNGWVKVSLDADHKYFYLIVSDSGVGIPEDAQEQVFERFYRVDKARSRETGGTGLGLAITKSVIILHHGAIRVSSQIGEGSTFTVRIPLKYLP